MGRGGRGWGWAVASFLSQEGLLKGLAFGGRVRARLLPSTLSPRKE